MLTLLLLLASRTEAFCGTYAGTAGATLTNQTSQMVVARQDGRTTLTLWSDLQGDLEDFALLVPVPPGTGAEDVGVTDPWYVEQLSTWSAPRLAAYTCRNALRVKHGGRPVGCGLLLGCSDEPTGKTSGYGGAAGPDADGTVEIEAVFTAGEYELAVLSAEDGDGLVEWLAAREFVLPDDPRGIVQRYVDEGSWFLAARVRLDALPADRTWLSPIQIGYGKAGFSVPIRIGTLSSSGEQDVLLYAIADSEVAITNYDYVEIERDCMPRLAEGEDLGDYHDRVLDTLTQDRARAGWTREHSWSMFVKCDPCTPSDDTAMLTQVLPELGYIATDTGGGGYGGGYGYGSYYAPSGALGAYVTRLRMRFRPDQIDQDLQLDETGLAPTPLQTRYVAYRKELETFFPVCGEGFAEDPGSCPVDEIGARGGCGVVVVPAPTAAFLALVVLLRRRR